jgi:hypothetical protein
MIADRVAADKLCRHFMHLVKRIDVLAIQTSWNLASLNCCGLKCRLRYRLFDAAGDCGSPRRALIEVYDRSRRPADLAPYAERLGSIASGEGVPPAPLIESGEAIVVMLAGGSTVAT